MPATPARQAGSRRAKPSPRSRPSGGMSGARTTWPPLRAPPATPEVRGTRGLVPQKGLTFASLDAVAKAPVVAGDVASVASKSPRSWMRSGSGPTRLALARDALRGVSGVQRGVECVVAQGADTGALRNREDAGQPARFSQRASLIPSTVVLTGTARRRRPGLTRGARCTSAREGGQPRSAAGRPIGTSGLQQAFEADRWERIGDIQLVDGDRVAEGRPAT